MKKKFLVLFTIFALYTSISMADVFSLDQRDIEMIKAKQKEMKQERAVFDVKSIEECNIFLERADEEFLRTKGTYSSNLIEYYTAAAAYSNRYMACVMKFKDGK